MLFCEHSKNICTEDIRLNIILNSSIRNPKYFWKARITNTEQSAQQKHSQGNFIKSGTNEKQQVSSKRVSRSIRYHPPPTDWLFSYFEDPCRRFVFAPACRGVTSKRSLGPGIGGAPIAAASAGTSLPLTSQLSSDDDIEKIKVSKKFQIMHTFYFCRFMKVYLQ